MKRCWYFWPLFYTKNSILVNVKLKLLKTASGEDRFCAVSPLPYKRQAGVFSGNAEVALCFVCNFQHNLHLLHCCIQHKRHVIISPLLWCLNHCCVYSFCSYVTIYSIFSPSAFPCKQIITVYFAIQLKYLKK